MNIVGFGDLTPKVQTMIPITLPVLTNNTTVYDILGVDFQIVGQEIGCFTDICSVSIVNALWMCEPPPLELTPDFRPIAINNDFINPYIIALDDRAIITFTKEQS